MNTENKLDQNITGYDEPITGEITFDDVSFGYNDEETSLENINIKIAPGQTVAIVGQTGSGKPLWSK